MTTFLLLPAERCEACDEIARAILTSRYTRSVNKYYIKCFSSAHFLTFSSTRGSKRFRQGVNCVISQIIILATRLYQVYQDGLKFQPLYVTLSSVWCVSVNETFYPNGGQDNGKQCIIQFPSFPDSSQCLCVRVCRYVSYISVLYMCEMCAGSGAEDDIAEEGVCPCQHCISLLARDASC